mmetsp:Transcript_2625/g.6659  ORF Transcript_2625/g.6659 Transcript_2625/m.6659 type:complete len:221 (+) Transcript_2625:90-752(+)
MRGGGALGRRRGADGAAGGAPAVRGRVPGARGAHRRGGLWRRLQGPPPPLRQGVRGQEDQALLDAPAGGRHAPPRGADSGQDRRARQRGQVLQRVARAVPGARRGRGAARGAPVIVGVEQGVGPSRGVAHRGRRPAVLRAVPRPQRPRGGRGDAPAPCRVARQLPVKRGSRVLVGPLRRRGQRGAGLVRLLLARGVRLRRGRSLLVAARPRPPPRARRGR